MMMDVLILALLAEDSFQNKKTMKDNFDGCLNKPLRIQDVVHLLHGLRFTDSKINAF